MPRFGRIARNDEPPELDDEGPEITRKERWRDEEASNDPCLPDAHGEWADYIAGDGP